MVEIDSRFINITKEHGPVIKTLSHHRNYLAGSLINPICLSNRLWGTGRLTYRYTARQAEVAVRETYVRLVAIPTFFWTFF
jgi:hypothetical protein